MGRKKKKVVYIIGPMRGYPEFNFPAFDEARDRAIQAGFDLVISPADLDREDKNEDVREHLKFCKGELDSAKKEKFLCRRYARRDVSAIFKCTHVALLNGWEKSVGGNAEFA